MHVARVRFERSLELPEFDVCSLDQLLEWREDNVEGAQFVASGGGKRVDDWY